MGVSAIYVAAAATVASSVYQGKQARDARKDAERQAELERQALAELQAEPEPTLPGPDDDAARRGRRRSITAQMRRRGRASTILTGQSSNADALGA